MVAVGTEKTRTIVPLSEAVASNVPSLLKETTLKGLLWASITLTGCKEMVSKTTTSPVRFGEVELVNAEEEEEDWLCVGNANGDEDWGAGDGYAR